MHREDARSQRLQEAGAQVAVGSLEDLEDLGAAMAGARRAYFCPPLTSGTLRRAALFATAAVDAKLEVGVVLSQWLGVAGHPALHASEKWISSRVFEWAPLDVVTVNPGWFADNYMAALEPITQLGLMGCRGRARIRPHVVARNVTMCFGHSGVFELDASGEWRKVNADAGALPISWKEDGFGGAWDPKRERVTIWYYDNDDNVPRFYGWDGATLKGLTNKGLPKFSKLKFDLYAVCSHPIHGLVFRGGGVLYALDDEGWTRLPDGKSPPPPLRKIQICHDSKRDALILGPGAKVNDDQRVFWDLHDGVWRRLGVEYRKSPTEALYDHRLNAVVDGRWIATATLSMHSMFFDEKSGWTNVLDRNDGRKFLSGESGGADGLLGLVAQGADPIAVGTQGRCSLYQAKTAGRSSPDPPPPSKTDRKGTWSGTPEPNGSWSGGVR